MGLQAAVFGLKGSMEHGALLGAIAKVAVAPFVPAEGVVIAATEAELKVTGPGERRVVCRQCPTSET